MTDQVFAYEKVNGNIRILRCYGISGRVSVPEEIEGLPVTELSDYVFAGEQDNEPENISGLPCICGMKLEELYLPGTIMRLGRYVFYNCRNLRKLSFHSNIAFMGAGVFTGCDKLSYLVMYQEAGASCLREILQDLKQAVLVDCYLAGKIKYRLVYPEFFEEAVENTPARIISTQTHGMGIQYRNAFRNTQVIFKEYDRLFETGKYNIELINIIEMAIARLRYPYELEEQAKREYGFWLKEHIREAAEYFLERKRQELTGSFGKQETWGDLRWMAEEFAETREEAELLVQAANDKSDTEALSLLMDVMHRRFPLGKKRFEL